MQLATGKQIKTWDNHTCFRIALNLKKVIRDKDRQYFLIRRIAQDVLTLIIIYAPNIDSAKYVRLLLTNLEKHMDRNGIVLGDVNMPLSPLDRSIKHNYQ